MTREEVMLAMDTINAIEELEKQLRIIKTAWEIEFVNHTAGENVTIREKETKKELIDLARLQIQTRIDEFKNQLRELGVE